MSKKAYLIVSGLLAFKFLQNGLFPFITADLIVLLITMWSILGLFYYPTGVMFNRKTLGFVGIVLICLVLSVVTPAYKYNQDVLSTFIAMRHNIVLLLFVAILKISPTAKEVEDAIKTLAMVALVMSFFVLIAPQLFVDEDTLGRLYTRQKLGSTDIVVLWPGNACAVIYFFILLQKTAESRSIENLMWCTVFMAYIFIMQNRSTLLIAVPLYFYCVMKKRTAAKYILVGIVLLAASPFIVNVANSLIGESSSQLSDSKYNRWQAISYFLYESDYSVYTFLFGHGNGCAGSDYLKVLFNAQNSRNAILSDIGMIGTFYLYGFVLVATVYYYVVTALSNKKVPSYLKYYCLWIIAVPTIHSLGQDYVGGLKVLIILYLIIWYSTNNKSNNKLLYEKNIAH